MVGVAMVGAVVCLAWVEDREKNGDSRLVARPSGGLRVKCRQEARQREEVWEGGELEEGAGMQD